MKSNIFSNSKSAFISNVRFKSKPMITSLALISLLATTFLTPFTQVSANQETINLRRQTTGYQGKGIDQTIIVPPANDFAFLITSGMEVRDVTIDCQDNGGSAFNQVNDRDVSNVVIENVKVINCGSKSNSGFRFKGKMNNLTIRNYESVNSGVKMPFGGSGANGGAIWLELKDGSSDIVFDNVRIVHDSTSYYEGYGIKIMNAPFGTRPRSVVNNVTVNNMYCDVTNEHQKNPWNDTSPNFCIEAVNLVPGGNWKITNSFLDGAISIPNVHNYGIRGVPYETTTEFLIKDNVIPMSVAWAIESGTPYTVIEENWFRQDPTPVQAWQVATQPATSRKNTFLKPHSVGGEFSRGTHAPMPGLVVRNNVFDVETSRLFSQGTPFTDPVFTNNYIPATTRLFHNTDDGVGQVVDSGNSDSQSLRTNLLSAIRNSNSAPVNTSPVTPRPVNPAPTPVTPRPPVVVTPPRDVTPPTVPVLENTYTNDKEIDIKISNVTDNVAVDRVEIYKDDKLVTTLRGVDTYTDSGLSPETPFRYHAIAFDTAGNASSPSQALVVKTKSEIDCVAPRQVGQFNTCFFDGTNFERYLSSEINSNIDKNWGLSGPARSGNDTFSVRFVGNVKFDQTGLYQLRTLTDDGARVYIDGVLMADYWKRQRQTSFINNVYIKEGVHEVKVEYFEFGGSARVSVNWSAI